MDQGSAHGTGLGRRELLLGSAGAVAAVATLSSVARAAEKSAAPSLASLAAECVERGEECTSHCLAMFASGDTTLAACARSVHEMTAVCGALGRLASLESTHLRTLIPVCLEICEACEKECRRHAKDHEVCAACADACKEMAAALKKSADA